MNPNFPSWIILVPPLSKNISLYLTCETDFVGLDITGGSSLVGALRIRLDRRNAIGKLSLLFNSSSIGIWLISLSWLVSSFFFISCISSSLSFICLRFLPLVGVFISCKCSSFFDVLDTVRRFFLFQFFDFRRPRNFFGEVFNCLSSWLLLISCAIIFWFVSSDETTRERWEFLSIEFDDSWSDGISFLIVGDEKDFFGLRIRFFSILTGA